MMSYGWKKIEKRNFKQLQSMKSLLIVCMFLYVIYPRAIFRITYKLFDWIDYIYIYNKFTEASHHNTLNIYIYIYVNRHNIENRIIFKLGTLSPLGLNTKFDAFSMT